MKRALFILLVDMGAIAAFLVLAHLAAIGF